MTTIRRSRGEDGAVALLVAISMVGLCVVAGLVIDLGLLRVDRQTDKSAEDSAALAGVDGLISSALNPSLHPFAGVCQAMNYLKVNSDRFASFASSAWSNGSGGAISGSSDGCAASHATDVCTPNTPSTWARWVGNNGHGVQVTIQSGYKTVQTNTATDGNLYSITGGAFGEESLSAYAGDPGAASYGGCDQLVVIINQVRGTTLGSPVTTRVGTRIRSVARVKIIPPTSPFALLILDRTSCLALANTSNGTINVTGYQTSPGLIHVDSDASGAQCTSKNVIQGAKADGVVAHEAPTGGTPGEITEVASTKMSDGLTNVWSGPASAKTAPVTSSLVTRSVLDSIYQAGVQAAVSAARPFVTATTLPAGWPAASSKTCPSGSGTTTWNDTLVFVNCSNLNKNVSMPNATTVIFTGKVSADVSMPKATRAYIAGSSPTGVNVASKFEMNNVTAGTSCPTAFDTTKSRAQLFIGNGSLSANGGTFRACNTTIILEGGDTTAACVPTTSPTYYPAGNICPTATRTSAGNGTLSLGGGTVIDWTAPDIVDDSAPASTVDHTNLEDLALWTETSGTHTLGGGGSMHLLGVFAAPNADIKLNGGPVSNVANSQYIAKTLNTTGNGTLSLTPLPSLPVAPPKISYVLVR